MLLPFYIVIHMEIPGIHRIVIFFFLSVGDHVCYNPYGHVLCDTVCTVELVYYILLNIDLI